MKCTIILPKEVGTEFSCTWKYEDEFDCNMFIITEDGVLVLSKDGKEYVKKDEEDVFPWAAGEHKVEYTFVTKGAGNYEDTLAKANQLVLDDLNRED